MYNQHHKLRMSIIALLVCLIGMAPAVIALADSNSAGSAQVYPKQYTIENLLSDYQYVTRHDLTAMGHTVGAISCGGAGSVASFGDGAISASYFHDLKAVGNYNVGNYLGGNSEYSGYKDLPAYYKAVESGVNAAGNHLTQYTGTGEYMNFDSAFASLSGESSDWSTKAHPVTASNITENQNGGSTLHLPLDTYQNIVIPKKTYDQVNYIQLDGVKDPADFCTKQYTISIAGSEPVALTFGYLGFSDSKADNIKGILYSDGKPFNDSNSLKNLLPGTINGGQMGTDGLKLIWNFPDATSILTDYTAGHIVAPSGAVTVKKGTGNFEGGILADSVVNQNAEAHFYPYNPVKPTTPTNPSSVPTSSVPTSSVPTSSVPTSSVPTSSVPTSSVPTSSVPTSSVPTSSVPTSSIPTSSISGRNSSIPSTVSGLGGTTSDGFRPNGQNSPKTADAQVYKTLAGVGLMLAGVCGVITMTLKKKH